MTLNPGTVQDGLTGKDEYAQFVKWTTRGRRWDYVKRAFVNYKTYSYGQVVLSSVSNLGKLLLHKHLVRDISRYPILVKSKIGKGYPAWVCSMGYIYKKTQRIRINVRFLEPLKYCEHLETIREEINAKKNSTTTSFRL